MYKFVGSSLTLGTISGIPVKVHWSFSIVLLLAGYVAYTEGLSIYPAFLFFSFIGFLFVFVVMHEFGHVFMARRYGVTTRDIILSPIGGVARLESIPMKPTHELWIALAGPTVNVVLFCVIGLIQYLLHGNIFPTDDGIRMGSLKDLMGNLIVINFLLVVFNLIPAFPMDGGRVLRALLSMGTGDKLKATRIASFIGQGIAVIFIILGLYIDHYGFILIGFFVIFTARAEYRQLRTAAHLSKTLVKDIMRTAFTTLNPSEPVSQIVGLKDEGSFLVRDDNGLIVGVLPSLFLKSRTEEKEESIQDSEVLLVQDRMITQWGFVSEGMNLQSAFRALNEYGWALAPVVDTTDTIVGVIDRDILRAELKRI
ncbi:MAG: Zn-dependent protease/predicted transcriptional regulator [Saprospiraceae bacterium]|jgi:Zn-dependent protease/predicted transcriptional regulator